MRMVLHWLINALALLALPYMLHVDPRRLVRGPR